MIMNENDMHKHGCCSEHEHDCHCTEHQHEHHDCCHDEHECGCHHHEHHHHEHGHHHHHEHDCGCGCGCHHHEGSEKEAIIKIGVASALLAAAWAIEANFNLPTWALLLIYIVPYLVVGLETLYEAVEDLFHGHLLGENILMAIATIGALTIGFLPGAEHQFPEAVFVMLFFQVGELFEHLAEGRSRKSIAALMDIRPDVATVERNGATAEVNPAEVKIGETIVVKPGERIPLDGVVIEGESSLDTVALTGESVPRTAKVDDEVISGCVNLSGMLRIRTTKSFGESTASKVLELVEHASEGKSRSESFIRRFARVYTPVVVVCALIVAFVPPIFSGAYLEALPTWIYRALTFLVVSCPCALVISVPLTFFGGIGAASRNGILVKGANYLEALAKMEVAVFDKTGTLTHGEFAVSALHPHRVSERELLHLAAHVERYSNHPIAISLKNAFPEEPNCCTVSEVAEIAGHGVRAMVEGQRVAVGNEKMMAAEGAKCEPCGQQHSGTVIHVAIDGEYAGHIEISDRIKDDAKEAIDSLKRAGVSQTVMLTGDHTDVANHVAEAVGIDKHYANLLPADKVARVENLLAEKTGNGTLAFIGDGINDAPVLARADVGIAMGALGSDAAIEAADVVLMDDKPSKIAHAIRIAKRTIGIARQNVAFSIGVKVAVLLLATFGIATLWMAVIADVGVMVLAVLNATRALRP